MNRSSVSDVSQTVAAIIDDIRKNGDEALLKYTHQFDKNSLDINNILLEVYYLHKSLMLQSFGYCE